MQIQSKKRSTLLFIGLILLVIAGCVMSLLIWHRIARAPTPQEQTKPAGIQGETTFTLPNSQVKLPLAIPASSFALPDGPLVLVNKSTPIAIDYAPAPLVLPNVPYRTDKSREEVKVKNILQTPLEKMFMSAKMAHIELMIGSAYRSAALQKTYFDNYVATDGLAAAEKYSAHPGTSEHQTGLAVDLTTVDRKCYLVECFADTEAGKWLALHAHEYGFILRYPKGKDDLTGYEYEPWHFRYVGQPYATAIYESGLTYEEVYPLLKAHEG